MIYDISYIFTLFLEYLFELNDSFDSEKLLYLRQYRQNKI